MKKHMLLIAAVSALAGGLATQAFADKQPHMVKSLALLEDAKKQLESATPDKGGHRVKAIDLATGAKMVFEDTCVGCKVCTIACPFGTINYNQDSGKVQKCDLCEGNPACASACPTGAITYVDADWTGIDKMRAWAAKANTPASAAA